MRTRAMCRATRAPLSAMPRLRSGRSMWVPIVRDEERLKLLVLARATIAAHLAGEPAPRLPVTVAAGGPEGVFVTLLQNGRLRGCIGRLESPQTLARTVAECAVSAATADPRFPPVGRGELPGLDL